MKLIRLGFVLMLIALGLAACNLGEGEVAQAHLARDLSPNISTAEYQSVVDGNGAFAFDLYLQVRGDANNLIYSPYSISLAGAMLYGGAKGETARQIADTLHFTLPPDQFHPSINALVLDLAKRPDQARDNDSKSRMELNIANAVWSQKDYPFEQAYLDLLAVNYGAGIRRVDFANATAEASRQINAWVSRETKGKIREITSPDTLSSDTRLALTNAIYFKANWKEAFVEKLTKPAPFNLLDGTQVDVPTMQTDDPIPLGYTSTDGYFIVSLPYKGDQTEMVIVVPDAGKFSDFEDEFTFERFNQLSQALEINQFKLFMPKFEFTTDLDLKPILSALGMPLAFDETQADFGNITQAEMLFVNQALHKAYVLVNEEGTEAAASTFIGVQPTSLVMPPSELHIDRPFFFVIRDVPTGVILFVGRVVDPLESGK